MKTGPEHYRAAENRLEFASRISQPDSGYSDEDAARLAGLTLARAQVHATLAVAAAIALAGYGQIPADDSEAWMDAAATTRPKP